MAGVDELIIMEIENYRSADVSARGQIVGRLETLYKIKEAEDKVDLESVKARLEDERERITIENSKVDAEEKRILESERNKLEEQKVEMAQVQLEQSQKAERNGLIVRGVELICTIIRDLITIKSERRNMHELMQFEKSEEGFNFMGTSASKKFFLNKK